MPRELDLFGIYVPSLFAAFLVAVPAYAVVDRLFARNGAYRWVWHIDLFRLCLFVAIFGLFGNALYR